MELGPPWPVTREMADHTLVLEVGRGFNYKVANTIWPESMERSVLGGEFTGRVESELHGHAT